MSDTWEDKCIKHQAWERAITALIDGDEMADKRYVRCLKYGTTGNMTDLCWTELIADYP